MFPEIGYLYQEKEFFQSNKIKHHLFIKSLTQESLTRIFNRNYRVLDGKANGNISLSNETGTRGVLISSVFCTFDLLGVWTAIFQRCSHACSCPTLLMRPISDPHRRIEV